MAAAVLIYGQSFDQKLSAKHSSGINKRNCSEPVEEHV